jgi:hypothetical protein
MSKLADMIGDVVGQVEGGFGDDTGWSEYKDKNDLYFNKEIREFVNWLLIAAQSLVSGKGNPTPPEGFTDQWILNFVKEAKEKRLKDDFQKVIDALKEKHGDQVDPSAYNNLLEAVLQIHQKDCEKEEDEPSSDDPVLKVVHEGIAIKLAREFTWNILDKATNRVLRLWNLILTEGNLPKSSAEFLEKVGRCYIWGFDSECVILCRGVLDTLFCETISDEICEKYGDPESSYGYTFSQRIKAAKEENIIDKHGYRAAMNVKVRGDKSIHVDPNITQNIFGTIQDTLLVVGQITKHK